MNQSPLITVVIFASDAEHLDQTLASVELQNMSSYQVWLYYKGQSEEIEQMAFKWSNVFSRLKIQFLSLPKELLLLQLARTITTEFFVFINSGDVILPGTLDAFQKHIMLHPNTSAIVQQENSEHVQSSLEKDYRSNNIDHLLKWLLPLYHRKTYFSLSSILFKTDAFKQLSKPFEINKRKLQSQAHLNIIFKMVEQGLNISILSRVGFFITDNHKISTKICTKPYKLLELEAVNLYLLEQELIDPESSELLSTWVMSQLEKMTTEYPELDIFLELRSLVYSTYKKQFFTVLEEYDKRHQKWLNAFKSNAYRNTDPYFFTPYTENSPISTKIKPIAFYLPQFHPFPENDKWWGKGFTEWYNVARAKPMFDQHYQPHSPIHCGYYDLRLPIVMEEQAQLAKNYGIYGFNYYFYWFNGVTLMEQPLKQMLNNPAVDMPFCLTWANENWTRRWDGRNQDILIEQKHSKQDSHAFINHIMPYLQDKRYITIDNRPVLIVYRAGSIPNVQEMLEIWRHQAQKSGLPDLYIISAQAFEAFNPYLVGFDAAMQFPPHYLNGLQYDKSIKNLNKEFKGKVLSYSSAVKSALEKVEPEYKLLKTAMLGWDNTARRGYNGNVFNGFSIEEFKKWFNHICSVTHQNDIYSSDEKIVFINAWNEWAEGTHLEPDNKYGYSYLQAVYEVLKKYSS